jgi:hypothetical protein
MDDELPFLPDPGEELLPEIDDALEVTPEVEPESHDDADQSDLLELPV